MNLTLTVSLHFPVSSSGSHAFPYSLGDLKCQGLCGSEFSLILMVPVHTGHQEWVFCWKSLSDSHLLCTWLCTWSTRTWHCFCLQRGSRLLHLVPDVLGTRDVPSPQVFTWVSAVAKYWQKQVTRVYGGAVFIPWPIQRTPLQTFQRPPYGIYFPSQGSLPKGSTDPKDNATS